jgi:hypothetical protein
MMSRADEGSYGMMRASVAGARVWALAGAMLLLVAQGGALGQSVVINGVRLATTRKPVTVGGTMLLPMRDVFEALHAQVNWFAAGKRVVGVRGETTIELRVGRTTALVNGRPAALAVAPRLIGGSVYVPLRFPSEAFGGSVTWWAATRTAWITIPPPGQPTTASQPPQPPRPAPPPQPPPTPRPSQPPVAAPTSVEGTVVQVIADPRSLVMAVSGTGLAQAVTLGPNTTLTRHVPGQPARAAQLTEAAPGDYAVATIAPDGVAQTVDLTYGEAEGMLAGVSDNNLMLKDNTVYPISPGIVVLDQAGRKVALWDVPANAPIKLRYQPRTRMVFEVRLLKVTPPPPPPGKPSIMLIGLLNDDAVLKAGDVLKVQLQGSAGGAATATLGEVFRDLPLAEVEPGLYHGEFTIRANTNERHLPLVGNLVVNGLPAAAAATTTRVTIDTNPPRIKDVSPIEYGFVSSGDAVIEADFDPGAGAPINPASATLSVNGARVRGSNVTADHLGYQAQDLQGLVRAEISVEDLAGNRATRSWTFTVTGGRAVFKAEHDADVRATLTAGDVLHVTMRARKPGGIATFDLEDLQRGLPMPRVGVSNVYRGEYVVQRGDRLIRGIVTIRYRDPDGVETTVGLTTRVTIETTPP